MWVAVILAVAFIVGAAVQGLVGLGLGLVAAPIVTLIEPQMMPGLLLWLAFFMPVVTLAREIGIAVAVMVLASVLLSLTSVRWSVNPGTLLVAGVVSGITGTTTSIGGPPMAILYQYRTAAQIRSTLAVYFLLGTGLSLAGLGVTGSLDRATFFLATVMVPCLMLGFLASRVLRRVVPAEHIRGGAARVRAFSGRAVGQEPGLLTFAGPMSRPRLGARGAPPRQHGWDAVRLWS